MAPLFSLLLSLVLSCSRPLNRAGRRRGESHLPRPRSGGRTRITNSRPGLEVLEDRTVPSTFTEFMVPTPNGQPGGITVGDDGNLWFSEDQGNKIGRITTAGVITEFAVPTPASRPYDITAGPNDGNVWYATVDGNLVGRVTPSGAITEFPGLTPLSYPVIFAGPDGNLWVTEFTSNQIARVTPSGTFTHFDIPTPNGNPVQITAGPDGAMWFTERDASKIGRITVNGTFTEYVIPTPNSGPNGITTGPDGNIWFVEWFADKVGKLTLGGQFTEYALASGSDPNSIEVGPDGNLWFLMPGTNKLGRITLDGVITEFDIPTPNAGVIDLITGPDGHLWFTEKAAGKIGRFVLNTAPTVGPISAPVDPVQVGVSVGASADFTDPDVLDTHTAVWDWGDGTTSAGTVTEADGSGTVTGSHTYATPGVYTVTLTVTDNSGAGNASGQGVFRYVVVYDPESGRLTGGGRADSPSGALVGSTASGTASFGLNARYPNGSTTPTGHVNFNFPAGDFHFRSTTYQVLVVNGFRSQLTGTGDVNGTPGYSFRLTAYDGDLPGGGGTDRFRIKIWNTASGAVVYDNVPGAADDLNNANPQPIVAGNLVIHAHPLQAAGQPGGAEVRGETLSDGRLQPLLAEAVNRWQSAGAGAAALQGVEVSVADLPGTFLGLASGNTIWIDVDAAGRGWFIDATPWDDSEFTMPGDHGEEGRIDLLTVVMHEMGHVLGLGELDSEEHAGELMAATLTTGTRRLPVIGQLTGTPMSAGTTGPSAFTTTVQVADGKPVLTPPAGVLDRYFAATSDWDALAVAIALESERGRKR